jgi:hypothetical protein
MQVWQRSGDGVGVTVPLVVSAAELVVDDSAVVVGVCVVEAVVVVTDEDDSVVVVGVCVVEAVVVVTDMDDSDVVFGVCVVRSECVCLSNAMRVAAGQPALFSFFVCFSL